jgi:hypothetical protein
MFETLLIAAMTIGAGGEADVAAGPTCHANGLVFGQGQVVCLEIPCAPQLARCGMVLNNSAWIKIQDGCVVSSRPSQSLPASGVYAQSIGPVSDIKSDQR